MLSFGDFSSDSEQLQDLICGLEATRDPEFSEKACVLARRLFTHFIQIADHDDAKFRAKETREILEDAMALVTGDAFASAIERRIELLRTFEESGLEAFEAELASKATPTRV